MSEKRDMLARYLCAVVLGGRAASDIFNNTENAPLANNWRKNCDDFEYAINAAGYAIVPREATYDMKWDGERMYERFWGDSDEPDREAMVAAVWSAMIAKAEEE